MDPSERPLDETVSAIAGGRLDRQKQDALYVRIGKTGQALSNPSQFSRDVAKVEVDRSDRVGTQLRPYDRAPGMAMGLDSEKLIALFKLLTGGLTPEEFGAYWWAT